MVSALRGPTKLTVRRAGIKVDREKFAEQIAPLGDALSTTLTALERDSKENQQTLDAKTKAFAVAERSLGPGRRRSPPCSSSVSWSRRLPLSRRPSVRGPGRAMTR